jgi:hypothetical protein
MDPQSLVIVFRMVERILGVALGGLLVYFGYRLFLDVRGKRGGTGSGDFSFAGGNKVRLSKVGPGVFFAVFGAGILVFSLFRPVQIETSGQNNPGQSSATAPVSVKFLGAASVPNTDEERARRRQETAIRIAALNKAVAQIPARATAQERKTLEEAVVAAKLALMEPLWDDDWGDLADFRDWLEKGGAVPAGTQPAVDYFQQK